MVNILIVVILIAIIYFLVKESPCFDFTNNKKCEASASVENNSLNDMETSEQMCRSAVYDDTARINNQIFWLSDYSHSGFDSGKDLNDDILTPIVPVTGNDAMNYYANMRHVSRFGCEKS